MKNLKSLWLCKLLLAFGLCLLFPAVSSAANMAISPSDDSYVEDVYPNSNFGGSTILYVGDENYDEIRTEAYVCRSYLKFGLSGIPAGARITSAKLYLYSFMVGPLPPGITVSAHYLGDDTWSEGTITWNNAPTTFNATPTDANNVDYGHIHSWDITSDVQTALAGDSVLSEVLKSTDEASHGWVAFCSKGDIEPSFRPYLYVSYVIPVVPTVSQWGLIVLAIALLSVGGFVILRRKRTPAIA